MAAPHRRTFRRGLARETGYSGAFHGGRDGRRSFARGGQEPCGTWHEVKLSRHRSAARDGNQCMWSPERWVVDYREDAEHASSVMDAVGSMGFSAIDFTTSTQRGRRGGFAFTNARGGIHGNALFACMAAWGNARASLCNFMGTWIPTLFPEGGREDRKAKN